SDAGGAVYTENGEMEYLASGCGHEEGAMDAADNRSATGCGQVLPVETERGSNEPRLHRAGHMERWGARAHRPEPVRYSGGRKIHHRRNGTDVGVGIRLRLHAGGAER